MKPLTTKIHYQSTSKMRAQELQILEKLLQRTGLGQDAPGNLLSGIIEDELHHQIRNQS